MCKSNQVSASSFPISAIANFAELKSPMDEPVPSSPFIISDRIQDGNDDTPYLLPKCVQPASARTFTCVYPALLLYALALVEACLKSGLEICYGVFLKFLPLPEI